MIVFQNLSMAADIRLRVTPDPVTEGYYHAVAVADDIAGGRRVAASALSRNPARAAAFALAELAEALEGAERIP